MNDAKGTCYAGATLPQVKKREVVMIQSKGTTGVGELGTVCRSCV